MEIMKALMLEDEAGILFFKYTIYGWPPVKELPGVTKSFYAFRDYITSVEGVVVYMNSEVRTRIGARKSVGYAQRAPGRIEVHS